MGKQPIRPFRINRRHPMARGLVGFHVVNQPGFAQDIANGAHGRPVSGSNIAPVISRNGLAVSIEANNSLFALDEGPSGLRGATAFTVAAIAMKKGAPGWSNFPQLINRSNGGGALQGYSLYRNVSAGELIFQVNSNSDQVIISDVTSDNEWFTAIVSSEKLGATGNSKFSIDGAQQALTKNTLNDSAFPDFLAGHSIGATGTSQTASWYGGIELVAVWNRGFTEAEHAAFADDPYQITEPLYDHLRPISKASTAVDVSGTDISTTPSLDAGSITQTHAISGTDISAAPSVGAGTITQTHLVSGTDMSAAPSLDAGSITQTHAVSGTDISSTPALDAGSITQTHLISGTDMSATPTVGVGTALEVGQARAAAMRLGSTEATFVSGTSSAAIGGIATSATIGNDGKTGA